jgi:hypothetical protein
MIYLAKLITGIAKIRIMNFPYRVELEYRFEDGGRIEKYMLQNTQKS